MNNGTAVISKTHFLLGLTGIRSCMAAGCWVGLAQVVCKAISAFLYFLLHFCVFISSYTNTEGQKVNVNVMKLSLKAGASHCCSTSAVGSKQNGLNIWCQLIKVDQMWCNCSKDDLLVQAAFLRVMMESAAVNNWPRSAHHHCRWKCEVCRHHFWLLGFSPCTAAKDDTAYLTLRITGGDKWQIKNRCPEGRFCWGWALDFLWRRHVGGGEIQTQRDPNHQRIQHGFGSHVTGINYVLFCSVWSADGFALGALFQSCTH